MNSKQRQKIIEHGQKLLVMFPKAREGDPLTLCKKLRALELRAAAIALRLCNGPEYPSPEKVDQLTDAILKQVNTLLGNKRIPIFINRDPRGYALKILDTWMREHSYKLTTDWGGYGILAPEITGDE